MIDLDEIEQKCNGAIENGYGHLPVIECGNAVKLMEVVSRLRATESEIDELLSMFRQAEKDAARYRWLKKQGRHDYDVDDFFDGSCDRIDAKVDEAMQCNK